VITSRVESVARGTLILALAVIPATASAELVFFPSGRAMSVKAVYSDGDQLVLQLRSGGTVYADPKMIVRVAPDEVLYPEEGPAEDTQADGAADVDDITGLRTLATATAARHGVDARLVDAVIRVESAYRPAAVSPRGAQGLMQLMPGTARQYGAVDLMNPAINLDAGVRHLKRLLARYELSVALAAYNAGEGAVDRFKGIPPFRETRTYVSRILRLLDRS
jgi:soluble lytic murein transglycosylase-like protein